MIRKIIALMLGASFMLYGVSVAAESRNAELQTDNITAAADWKSWENKSSVSGDAYNVKSYSYIESYKASRNYRVTFDAVIKSGSLHYPAVFLRADNEMNGYRFTFNVTENEIALDKVVNGIPQRLASGEYTYGEKESFYAEVNAEHISFGTGSRMILSADDADSVAYGTFAADCGDGELVLENILYTHVENSEDEYYMANPSKDYLRSDYFREIEKITALGFMTAFEDGSFKPFKTVSRGELALILMRLANQNNSEYRAEFFDVASDNLYYRAAAYCVNKGYLRTDNRRFMPDDPAEYDDAVRALTLITGRRLTNGGADESRNYLSEAAGAGITDGIVSSNVLTRETAAKLVINTAECELMTYSSSGTKYSVDENKNILSEYHKIYILEGRVEQNSLSGLYASVGCANGYAVIDGVLVSDGDTDIGAYLGYCVNTYVRLLKSEEAYELVWFEADDEKNAPIVINAKDIDEKTTAESLSYSENGRGKKLSLPKNLICIYNGIVCTLTADILNPEVGEITVVRSGGRVFAVIVKSYKTMYSSSVSYNTGEVYDKYFDTEKLVLDENKCTFDIFDENGKKAPLERLYQNRVLSVAETVGPVKHYTIYVSLASVEGTYTSAGGDMPECTINGVRYDTLSYGSRLYSSGLVQKPQVGTEIIAHLDAFGNVAFMESKTPSEGIGYLSRIVRDSDSDEFKAYIFDGSGKWTEVYFGDKLIFNGSSFECSEKLPGEIWSGGACIPQLISYKCTGKDKLKSIDTAQPASFGSVPLALGETYKNIKYVSANTSFDARVYLDYSTLVISIPQDINDRDEYLSDKRGYFTDGRSYNVTCYNVNDYDVAGVVVVNETETSEIPKLARLFAVSGTASVLGDDGDVFMALRGFRDGKEVTAKIRRGHEKEFESIRCGDAVILKENSRGEVTGYSALQLVSEPMTGTSNPTVSLAADRIIVAGRVLKYDRTERRIRLDLGSAEKAFYFGNVKAVYVCDLGAENIQVSSIANVDVNDFVVCNFCWSGLYDIVIYKR